MYELLKLTCLSCNYHWLTGGGGGGRGTHYNGLLEELPSKRGTFFILQLYKKIGISLAHVKGKGNMPFLSVKDPNKANRLILWM